MIAIERLRTVRDHCLSGEPLDEDIAAWLGSRLDQFLCRDFTSFEEAFGLQGAKGGIPWWKEEQIRRRDAALRALARTLPADASTCARAREIHRLSTRYAAGTWRWERTYDDMPAHYDGTPREHLWQAFRSGAPMPLGERHLRNILGGV